MNGADIAREIGITRQAVSNILKKAMGKVYIEVGKLDKTMKPFEISCMMLRILDVPSDSDEIKKFYNLFPPKIKKEIEKDALDNHSSRKIKENFYKE
jgi:predicted transcriptional regulator